MNLRVLIVDDEELARRRLRRMLADEPGVELIGECSSGREFCEKVGGLSPHLVFLDVEMPGMNGFEALADFATQEGVRAPAIVFATAHADFTLRAFDAGAHDYLLKPFSRERLHACLERVRARLMPPAPAPEFARSETTGDSALGGLRRIAVRRGERVLYLPVEAVDWIEAASNYIVIHSGPESDVLRETLGSMEQKLPAGVFVRISRSALVRAEFLRGIERTASGEHLAVLGDGRRLRVTRKVRSLTEELRTR